MATFESRFSEGDIVWHYTTVSERVRTTCDSCEGRGNHRLPNTRDVVCPKCHGIGMMYHQPFTRYAVQQLTIGSVRYDSAPTRIGSDQEPFSYMCVETGVGSGSVYYESKLFSSEDDAVAHAEAAGHLPAMPHPETPPRSFHELNT